MWIFPGEEIIVEAGKISTLWILGHAWFCKVMGVKFLQIDCRFQAANYDPQSAPIMAQNGN
jgi:hypothetical protein